MKVFLSGPITNDPGYKSKFDSAEARLKAQGHTVLNPAILPNSNEITHSQYMAITTAMLDACEAILLLPGWTLSEGAKQEARYAHSKGIPVL